ncbi:non-specific serine/threonine protein kinase [Malassezia obtusa]|uniref:non-specific serine/threonine protein kinase n=1 Tax=Malassezia obtusa TaxID=76774 RepID=A0AAF0DZI5_9BASI|nr:non-specific serine/threonine protein kinase [Malassezia obtusa]
MAPRPPDGADAPRGRAPAAPPPRIRPRLVLDPTSLEPVRRAWPPPRTHTRSGSQRSDASDSAEDAHRTGEYASSSGIFELESDTPGTSTSGSDYDEPSTPLQASRRVPLPPGAAGRARGGTPGTRSFRGTLPSTMPSPHDPPPRYASASGTLRQPKAPGGRAAHPPFALARSYSGSRRSTPSGTMGPPPVPRHAQPSGGAAFFAARADARTATPTLHRRAHSTTGAGTDAILCSSPVGGVDGVDPQLVAAIGRRASGSAHGALGTPESSGPELSLSPPPDDLAHRLESLTFDSPGASPASRRADGLRLQRVPRSVALANDMGRSAPSRARTRRVSQLTSPHASPTEGAPSAPVLGLGLGLGLPSLDVRRSRSVDEADGNAPGAAAAHAAHVQRDACIVALSRAHKAQRWRRACAAWPAWTDAARRAPEAPAAQRAAAHWAAVGAELPKLDRSRASYVRLATGMRVVASVPALHSAYAAGDAPRAALPARGAGEHDVFGARRGVGEARAKRETRVVSDRVPSTAPKSIAGVRRQNTTMSIDDSVAAQRQQLWGEVVHAKSVCDAELDKILAAMLEYTEHVASVNEHSPDTTVMVADDAEFDPFAEREPLARPSDAALVPLQTMAGLATELRALSLHALLARPALCRPYIAEIQAIGTVWEEHPDWHGRGWYVELLLAVAMLSRVLEWWDAEHCFWSEEPRAPAPRRGSGGARWLHGAAAGGAEDDVSSSVSPTPLRRSSSASDAAHEPPSPAARRTSSANVLMELSLDEERILYVSPTWQRVVGTDAHALIDVPIASLLSARSAGIFSRATRQLRDHAWHTVELVCELAHLPGAAPGEPLVLEAQGMLVHHRATQQASHTMWVLRLADGGVSEQSMQQPQLSAHVGHVPEDGAAVNTELLLCRICEREIPAWFFAKHSEICHEIHRLEMEIGTVNEVLLELSESARALLTRLEHEQASSTARAEAEPGTPIAYRGQALALPPATAVPTALEGVAKALPLERASRALAVKHAAHAVEEALAVLDTAMAISTPGIRDDAPEDLALLLSPRSERNVEALQTWRLPRTHDAALAMLVADVGDAATNKVHAVNRMRNTIVYVETVRMESEQLVAELLARGDEDGVGPARDAPPVTLNDSPADLEQTGSLSGLLLDPMEDAVETDEEDGASATQAPSLSGQRSPIPIPNARHALRRASHTPLSSPRTAPGDARFLSIASPRLGTTPSSPGLVPRAQSKATVASIRDFELLKPISKGAYGSVYLARKRATGDHYAIKVLKKSDMIAKNQITNVRAERMILMNRTQSPFVVKLFFTFQSAEYLYLVMEYLPGGDCGSLVKTLGELPEAWAQQYLAEIVHGLAYLHSTGVVHRDMKPDNLLIDQRGHLKLTDFGLSKFGLLGRQTCACHEPAAAAAPIPTTWAQLPDAGAAPSAAPVPLASVPASAHPTEAYFRSMAGDAEPKRIVGTPDYLAPETILGVGMDEFGVDWWAVGVILFEFLCGYPPFHATTPNQVFDKILTRSIDWDTDAPMSDAARDLIERLICTDRRERLGARGVEEIRAHPFFAGIDWARLTDADGPFVPRLDDAASTDYFDPRGAVAQTFDEEPPPAPPSLEAPSSSHSTRHGGSSGSFVPQNEFGSFSYKNLPVLKQANDEMVRRICTESSGPLSASPVSSQSHTSAPTRPALLHRRALSDLPRTLARSTAAPSVASDAERPSSGRSHAADAPPLPVLVADFNPVSRRALECALLQAGAQPTLVDDGAEMCRLAMGETKYAGLFVKLALRVVNGQDVARMIKSTRNVNSHTPIVALMLRDDSVDPAGSVFDAILPLPAAQPELVALLHSLREEPVPSPYVLSPTLAGCDGEGTASLNMDRLAL